MIKVALNFILLLFMRFGLCAEVYFSPSTDCEDKIVKAINDSTNEIVGAVYSINNKKIVAALINAHKRKVKIRLLTDSVQASNHSSKVLYLKRSGIDIRLHSKYKIEHDKFAWFDGKEAVSGSFNWTGPASRLNAENCVFFNKDEQQVISAFKKRFDFLWPVNTAEKSNTKFYFLEKKQRTNN